MAPPGNDDATSPARSDSRHALWQGAGQSSAMGAELVAAILTWGGIGWLIDNWLGTMPWFMGGGAFIGNAAGLYLIWLRSSREEHNWRRQAPDTTGTSDDAVAQDRQRQGGEHGASR